MVRLNYCIYINNKLYLKEYNEMAEVKKVRVCKKCSGFDVAELKGKVKTKDCTTGCIGKCAGKCPELQGKVFGFLNGEFVVCDTKDEFFVKIAALA
jgi:hypothetical protein